MLSSSVSQDHMRQAGDALAPTLCFSARHGSAGQVLHCDILAEPGTVRRNEVRFKAAMPVPCRPWEARAAAEPSAAWKVSAR